MMSSQYLMMSSQYIMSITFQNKKLKDEKSAAVGQVDVFIDEVDNTNMVKRESGK